jgi:glycosyltransferase involved in cell wall biosynthesis
MRVFWTALRAHVERAVGEWRPDIAVIGHDMAATWARGLPESLPAVLTLHNLTWHWYLSRARRAHGADAVRLRAEAGRYRRYLVRLLPRFDAAVAVSTIEAEELRRLTTRRVTVIPSGVDTRAITVAPEPATEPPRLVFTASLGYPPNSQGIRWFADRVWPEVRRALPRARLDVVGRGAPHEVVVLGEREGITVVGEVERMDPYFARAHAVIVPILTGAGIRMKIVEAMAAGRPIVSTPLGWEGLPHIEPDRHLLVADDPPAFAAAVVRLLSEPELRARLAAQARRLAEEHYDWRGLGAEQEAVLERAYTARQ